jgi:hypothetical protein
VQNGVKPSPGEEPQSGTQITVCIPDSMATEISQRVKARRQKEPHFSRNDFVRNVFREHFQRHPLTDAQRVTS